MCNFFCIFAENFALMKRLLTLFIAILTILTAAAQEEKSINIDQSSFRPVQSDALTGANIDPIAKDSSRNPCARVKIRFANMLKAEVESLVVKFQSNTDIAKQIVSEYFDNVLIMEVTAKPNTRFYVQSPDYGQSNEVSINLKADCEYEMEARLNQTFSIVVNSNAVGGGVYIDNNMKERIDDMGKCQISDITAGKHTLKIEYQQIIAEQQIYVNKNSIYFRLDVDTAAAAPQWVVFNIEPKQASIEVDGDFLPVENEGVAKRRFSYGEHRYVVQASDYHPERGTFVVAGTKVEKSIKLKPAFGTLEISGNNLVGATVYIDNTKVGVVPYTAHKLKSGSHKVSLQKKLYKTTSLDVEIKDGQTTHISPALEPNFAEVNISVADAQASIYIDDTYKGAGSWSGNLEAGTYFIEARRDNHITTKVQKTITSSKSLVQISLDSPRAIVGRLSIDSKPFDATVYVDGVKINGATPIDVPNVLVGSRTIKITKDGYNDYTTTVKVTEGQETAISATLQERQIAQPTPTSTPAYASTSTPSGAYKIGDVVAIKGVRGVVFQTSPVVKIISVMEASYRWSEESKKIGTTDKQDGKANLSKIKSISGWQSQYPAHKWCTDLGEGWYLPAIGELEAVNRNKDAINQSLASINFPKLGATDSHSWIWSSTEELADKSFFLKVGSWTGSGSKILSCAVRAVYVVGSSSNAASASAQTPQSTPSANTPTSKKIGNIDMIYVAGGTFTMGATAEQGYDAESDEKPTHSVTVSDFYIGKYEVTQAQWKAIMGSSPSYFKGDNLPVENVSWNNIQEFITKLNAQTGKKFRLPTEAEWEYAARGGNQSKGYKYSGRNSISEVAWYDGNSGGKTHPVGQKSPNELGIYDMSGNVFEWCGDWYSSYSSSSQTNPTGSSSGSSRVLRGGSWYLNAGGCRVSNRNISTPDSRSNYNGFRLACSVESQPAASAQQAKPATTPAATTAPAQVNKVYKVGDYYNVNGKEGIVFEVSADGRHGKIVSLKQSGALQWASDSTEQSRTIATDYKSDGTKNLAKVREISGWQNKYPAFKWCTTLGSGWYLPSIDEIKKLLLTKSIRDVVNRTLVARGLQRISGTKYWSSTEFYEQGVPNKRIFIINLEYESTDRSLKSSQAYVRAVSKF